MDIDIELLGTLVEDLKSGRLTPKALWTLHERPYLVSDTYRHVWELWRAPKNAVAAEDLSCAAWTECSSYGETERVEVKSVGGCWTSVFLLRWVEARTVSGIGLKFDDRALLFMANGRVERLDLKEIDSLNAPGKWIALKLPERAEAFMFFGNERGAAILVGTGRISDRWFRLLSTDGRDLLQSTGFEPRQISNAAIFGQPGQETVIMGGKLVDAGPAGVFVSVSSGGVVPLDISHDRLPGPAYVEIVDSVVESRDRKRTIFRIPNVDWLKSHLYLDGKPWEPPEGCRGHRTGIYGFLEDGTPFHECLECHALHFEREGIGWSTVKTGRTAGEDVIRAIGNDPDGPILVIHRYAKHDHASFRYRGKGFALGVVDEIGEAITVGKREFALVYRNGKVSRVLRVRFDREREGYDRQEVGPPYRGEIHSLTLVPRTGKLAWVVSKREGEDIVESSLSVDGEMGLLHRKIHRLWVGIAADDVTPLLRYLAWDRGEGDGDSLHAYAVTVQVGDD